MELLTQCSHTRQLQTSTHECESCNLSTDTTSWLKVGRLTLMSGFSE
jgi:hypothetical protein